MARPDVRFVSAIAAFGAALQLLPELLGGYGYFIDELYYVACARRPALGYVDHPPLAPWLLRVQLELFGASLLSVRLLPALAGAATASVTALATARLGGGRYAQALAAVAVLLAPVLLVMFDLFSMNGFEVLLWTSMLLVVVVMIEDRAPRWWLAFGTLAGVALLNKHTVVLLGLGVVVGLALTRERSLLRSPWLFAGGAAALVLFLPNLVWQIQHDFTSLEFYRNATLFKNRPLPPWHALWNQTLIMNPITAPLWAGGLYFFWRRRPDLRAVVWTYALLLGLLVASASSRPDRMAGLYPILFAGGAVLWEGALRSTRTRAGALVLVIASGAALAPLFVPLVPPRNLERYAARLGLDLQIERGEGKRSALPQWLADRFGWPELVAEVERVVRSMPAEERRTATILVPSYGHAGAIELLGPGLPPVISPHNTYHLWSTEVVERLARGPLVTVGYDAEVLEPLYARVERVGTYRCGDCMPWRDAAPVYLAREPRRSPEELRQSWNEARHYE